MESRLLSHSAAGSSTAREALAGPAPFTPNVRPVFSSSRRNVAQLHIIARANAPAKVHSNGA